MNPSLICLISLTLVSKTYRLIIAPTDCNHRRILSISLAAYHEQQLPATLEVWTTNTFVNFLSKLMIHYFSALFQNIHLAEKEILRYVGYSIICSIRLQ